MGKRLCDLWSAEERTAETMKQLNFWHRKSGDGFYKFLAPCNHRWYREGDSLSEELGVSDNTLRIYMKKICVAYPLKTVVLQGGGRFLRQTFCLLFRSLEKMYFLLQKSWSDQKPCFWGFQERKKIRLRLRWRFRPD